MSFTGKIALVTGAANGIGEATARALAEQGARVWATDRDPRAGEAAVRSIDEAGYQVRFLSHDVTRRSDWDAVADEIEREAGRLDVLVNCAGRADMTPLLETPWSSMLSMLEVNLGGVYHSLQAFAGLLANRPEGAGWASVVNIASMAGIAGVPLFSSYGASKAALISLTKTASREFTSLKMPIRVNAVLPGTIDTAMAAGTQREMSLRSGASEADMRNAALARHPVGRFGTVEDVVFAILYLADERSGFSTGLSLPVSGGRAATD